MGKIVRWKLCLFISSFGQLDDFAPWRNVARALAKAANFPERVLARYQSKGELVTYTAELSLFQRPLLLAT